MKTKKQLLTGIIVLLILLIPTISKANMEIKPGTTTWANITVSEAYEACRDLDMGGSSLGTDGLDPHLALNKDWGAVAYLAVSASGDVKTKAGPTVTVGDRQYTTTTGNLTGVMDFGRNYTFVSSAHETGLETANTNDKNNYRTKLIKDKSTRYVELLPATATVDGTKGMAITETQGWFGSDTNYCSEDNPMQIRNRILGFVCRANPSGSFEAADRAWKVQCNFPPGNLEFVTKKL